MFYQEYEYKYRNKITGVNNTKKRSQYFNK